LGGDHESWVGREKAGGGDWWTDGGGKKKKKQRHRVGFKNEIRTQGDQPRWVGRGTAFTLKGRLFGIGSVKNRGEERELTPPGDKMSGDRSNREGLKQGENVT